MSKEIWKIIDIINWSKEYFQQKGVDSPRLTIELILCHALGLDRVTLYTQFDKPLKQNELDRIRDMVIRRAKREPLQQIIGHTEFCGLKINVDRSVIVPRPETELLAEKAKAEIGGGFSGKILDIGTGSGCISACLGKAYPQAEIHAIDSSEQALEVAMKNFRDNLISNVKTVKTDILKELPPADDYDLIISNPPYIPADEYKTLEPEVAYYEPAGALTDLGSGLIFYERFAEIFPLILKPGGRFFLEIGFGQKDSIDNIFSRAGYKVKMENDLDGIPRIIFNLTIP